VIVLFICSLNVEYISEYVLPIINLKPSKDTLNSSICLFNDMIFYSVCLSWLSLKAIILFNLVIYIWLFFIYYLAKLSSIYKLLYFYFNFLNYSSNASYFLLRYKSYCTFWFFRSITLDNIFKSLVFNESIIYYGSCAICS
jgi:hypothetical protein